MKNNANFSHWYINCCFEWCIEIVISQYLMDQDKFSYIREKWYFICIANSFTLAWLSCECTWNNDRKWIIFILFISNKELVVNDVSVVLKLILFWFFIY